MWLGPIYRPSPTRLAAAPSPAGLLPEFAPSLNATCNRDTVFYSPIYIAEAVTMETIGIYVGTGVVSCTARVGLYRDAAGVPGAKLGEYITGASVASTGQVQTTGLAVELTAGLWWRAIAATGGASHPQYRGLSGFSPWVIPASTTDLGAAGYTQAGSTLPSTAAPTSTAAQVPRIYMRAAA